MENLRSASTYSHQIHSRCTTIWLRMENAWSDASTSEQRPMNWRTAGEGGIAVPAGGQ